MFTNLSEDPNADKVYVFETSSAPVELKAGETYKWCPCGRAKDGMKCDSSHKKDTNFKSVPFTATEDKTYRICRCKMTKNPNGLCDGSHRQLPEGSKGTYQDIPEGGAARQGFKKYLNEQEAAKAKEGCCGGPCSGEGCGKKEGGCCKQGFKLCKIFKHPFAKPAAAVAAIAVVAAIAIKALRK